MGIKNLSVIIKENAPDAIKEGEIKNHFGRKVAIVRCPLCASTTRPLLPIPHVFLTLQRPITNALQDA
jgi:hypothetical protein